MIPYQFLLNNTEFLWIEYAICVKVKMVSNLTDAVSLPPDADCNIFNLQEILGHEDINGVKNCTDLQNVNVQAQKRKFSPGDSMPFVA